MLPERMLVRVHYLAHNRRRVLYLLDILPSMASRRKGHIVNIGSIQGLFAVPNRSGYSASKHALQAFSDSLRAEVADLDLAVTVVSPGYVDTNLSRNAMTGSGGNYGRKCKIG